MARHNSMIPDVLWDTFGSEFARQESDGPRPWLGVYASSSDYSEGCVVGTVSTGIDGSDCGNALWVATKFVPMPSEVDSDDATLFDPCQEAIRLDDESGAIGHWAFYAGRPIDLYGTGDPGDDEFLSLAVCGGGSTYVNGSTGITWTTTGDGTWTEVGSGGGGGGSSDIHRGRVVYQYQGEYDAGLNYAQDDAVKITASSVVALSMGDGNLGNDPLTDEVHWLPIAHDAALPILLRGVITPGTVEPIPAPLGSLFLKADVETPAGTAYVKTGTADDAWGAVKIADPDESYAIKQAFTAVAGSDDPDLFPAVFNGTPVVYSTEQAWALGWIMDTTVDGEVWWINASVRIDPAETTDSGGELDVDLTTILAAFGCTGWEGSQGTVLGMWNTYGGGGAVQQGVMGVNVSNHAVANCLTFAGGSITDPVMAPGGAIWLTIAGAACTFCA